MPMTVIPSAAFREVPPGQVLFSSTNERGEITGANENLMQICRYTSAQLLGERHSIVRHPSMPHGLYRLMWDRLEARQTVALYLLNLAGDGVGFWTFATIVPAGPQQFVMVAKQVSHPDHRATVEHIYNNARAAERKMLAAGMDMGLTAIESGRVIEGLVADHGYGSFDELMQATLDAEMSTWHKPPQPALPAGVTRQGHDIGRMLAASRVIDEEIEAMSRQLGDCLVVAHDLSEQAHSLQISVGDLARVVDDAASGAQHAAASAPVLLRVAHAASDMSTQINADLRELPATIIQVRAGLLVLREHLLVASLHNAAAESFAIDIALGRAPKNAKENLAVLWRVLTDATVTLEARWQQASSILLATADMVDQVGTKLANFQRMLLDWRNLVLRFRLTGELSDLLTKVDEQESRTRARVVAFRELAHRCRALVGPLSSATLHRAVETLHITGAYPM